MKRTFLFALSLLAAILTRYWIAPLATQLPSDYANEVHFVVDDQLRISLNDPWEANTFTARRTDQTLSNTGGVAIIQSALDWSTESGELIFENIGLYGVDRRSRIILPGYGDSERSGQYLFPTRVQQITYTYWDSQFIGARTATFDHAEKMDGLSIYVFHFTVTGIDETAGYSSLSDVPERFNAHTDGQGTLWIEPLSGIVIDYEEQGLSYFVDPKSGEHLADFHTWNDRYTPETRAAQLTLARAERLRILTLEAWLPAALLAMGIILLTGKTWKATSTKATQARQVGNLAPLQVLKEEGPV